MAIVISQSSRAHNSAITIPCLAAWKNCTDGCYTKVEEIQRYNTLVGINAAFDQLPGFPPVK
ncbi:MAG: hypothetical protein ACE1Y4_06005, partial [Lysobacterales bacterium]